MFDTEYKRVLDKSFRRADQQELQEQKDLDAVHGKLTPKHKEEFQAVTSSMLEVLDNKSTEDVSPHVNTSQRYALDALYMAKTAKNAETGEFISGIERNQHLNQALMYLQPVLAMALRPEFKEGRAIYDKLVGKIGQCRTEIRSAIRMQIMGRKRRKKGKKKVEEAPKPVETTPEGQAAEAEAGKETDGVVQADPATSQATDTTEVVQTTQRAADEVRAADQQSNGTGVTTRGDGPAGASS